MKLIIEARIEDSDDQAGEAIVVDTVQRRDGTLADLGLSVAEGRSLLGQMQCRTDVRARRGHRLKHRWPRCGSANHQ